MAAKTPEERLREVEKFIIEIRAGKKMLLLVASAIGGGLMVLGAFWDHIFGGSS